MSSDSSSRYQSKVFNFLNQHSQRLTQQWENTIRHLQVATKWSVEALLYPLYQIFQPDELEGKRLQTKANQPQPQLQLETHPPADAPIQHVLELIKNLPSVAASDSQTSQNVNPLAFLRNTMWEVATRLGWRKAVKNKPHIESSITQSPQPENTLLYNLSTLQGIAVKLDNRHLILVSEDNRIFDVLTIQQQVKLADKINSEVTEYWDSFKLAHATKEQELLPEIDGFLSKLTSNTNPGVADVTERRLTENIQSYPSQIFALLDTALAKLEAKTLVPVKQRSQEIIQLAKTQLDIFIYGKDSGEARRDITVNAGDLENLILDISALIEAAINYFFGSREIPQTTEDETLPELPTKPVNQVLKNNQLQESDLTGDLWLTWGDLFGGLAINEINADEFNQILASDSFTEDTQQCLFKCKQSTKSTPHSHDENGIETARPQYQLEPDWIETTATFLGYEKHPLEQILAWLDHVMLWIEMIFMNMIYFFKGLLQV
jgi:hypothetical protein